MTEKGWIMTWQSRFGQVLAGAAGAAATAIVLASSAATPAAADVRLSVFPSAPDPLVIGQTAVTERLRITNTSTAPEASQTITLNDTITLVPSCGALVASPDCPPGAADTGVLLPSPGATGRGESGTACSGIAFSIVLVDAVQGKYLFTPATPVTLGHPSAGVAASCIIDLPLDVGRLPQQTVEAGPTLLTAQLAFADATASDRAGGGAVGSIELGIIPPGGPVGLPPARTSSSVTTPGPSGPRPPARLTLSVAPHSARVGQTITFTGRLLGGPVPPHGKQIALEAAPAGGGYQWVTFKIVRTDARGIFTARYRFRLAGPERYKFRAVSRVEAGYPYATGRSNQTIVVEPR